MTDVKRAVAVTCAAMLAGCQSMPTHEIAWQSLHAVDTYQTMNIARNPDCFREADPLTRAIVGEHPSTGEVAAVMVAYSLGHWYVSRYLDRKVDESSATDANRGTLYVLRAAWIVGGLFGKAVVVGRNNALGLGPLNYEECNP